MTSLRERFPLREEERRRARGDTALFLGSVGAATLVAAYFGIRVADAAPALSDYLRVILPAIVAVLLVLGGGLYVRLRPRHFVEVDPTRGTVTVVRDGRVRREMPLSGIAPLRHSLEERLVQKGKQTVTATFHVARSGPLRELCLHASEDEAATRRVLEAYAKAWRVPYVTATRETRDPWKLDVPIHERLADDEEAKAPLPRRAGSKLTVSRDGSACEITTSYRPPASRTPILVLLLLPVLVSTALFGHILEVINPDTPAIDRAVVGFPLLLLLAMGPAAALQSWLRTRRPPVIRISAAGFQYRGTTIPLWSIEDVARAPGAVCRVVSDARIIEVEGDFCEPSERDWLHHEVRRLVIEAGRRAPAA